MSVLSRFQGGFLDELEKLSSDVEKNAGKLVKETRKAWSSSKTRKGRRPMRVSTLLKKEKEGTLGGYKFAHVLQALAKNASTQSIVPFTVTENGGEAKLQKKPGDVPSREDNYEAPRREDGRGSAHTLLPASTHLNEVAATNQPQERTG